MANDDRTTIVPRRTPESAAMLANVKRAMAITAALNRLTFDDADEVRALFSEPIGDKNQLKAAEAGSSRCGAGVPPRFRGPPGAAPSSTNQVELVQTTCLQRSR